MTPGVPVGLWDADIDSASKGCRRKKDTKL
jgi:hypothetical protein